MSAETNRWTDIRKLHVEAADSYRIFGGVMLVLMGIWIGSVLFAADNGYSTNLYTEFISIGVTVFILDFLNRRRDDARRIRELRERLLRDVRSPENTVAKHAVYDLRELGWLKGDDSILTKALLWGAEWQGAYLEGANLAWADLEEANLERVYLGLADLRNAHLDRVNLASAFLTEANLQNAHFWLANLQGTDLRQANFQSASLKHACLKGAHLQGANLKWAYIKEAEFDSQTRLPDGTLWTPNTDITRFTDPEHPDFWRSDDPGSPAYQGDETNK